MVDNNSQWRQYCIQPFKNSGVGIASSSQVLGAHWSIIFRNDIFEIGVKLLMDNQRIGCHGHIVSPGQPLTKVYRDDLKLFEPCYWNIWEQFWKFIEMFYWHSCSAMPCQQLVSDVKKLLGVWAFCNFITVICTFALWTIVVTAFLVESYISLSTVRPLERQRLSALRRMIFAARSVSLI